jgi:hypothetical protein
MKDMANKQPAITIWQSAIQPRRRPTELSPGGASQSNIGAQRNLNA